jgi:hypothetical protein
MNSEAMQVTPDAAAAVMALARAYHISQAVYVAAKIGLADHLATGPRSVDDLAAATVTHAPSLHRLLRMLAAYDVVREQDDGRFALRPIGAALQSDVPGAIRDGVLMYVDPHYWQSWASLLPAIQTGDTAVHHAFGAANTFDHHAHDHAFGAVFNAAMTAFSALNVPGVVGSYDFSGARHVVDVGGGHGRLLSAVLQANPGLRGTLFDLPRVVVGAPPVLAEAGVAARCEILGGDMFAAVPPGADLYLLSHIIHDWDDDKAAAILANCNAAMAAGGKVVLVEMVLPDRIEPGPAAQADMMNDLNMLVRDGGKERTEAEFAALFAAAGLQLSRVIKTAVGRSVLEATA